jgi:hypothetical protein
MASDMKEIGRMDYKKAKEYIIIKMGKSTREIGKRET